MLKTKHKEDEIQTDRQLISEEAWDYLKQQTEEYGYTGKAHHHGVGAYLYALFTANPTASCWSDTRPAHVKQHDAPRLATSRFPIWIPNDGQFGVKRNMNADYVRAIRPTCLAIADYHLIRSPRRLTPTSTINAVIECVGLQYLTPSNRPEYCSRPAETKNQHVRRRASELIF